MVQGPKDPAKLEAAGYKGEKVLLLAATDFPIIVQCEPEGHCRGYRVRRIAGRTIKS